MRNFCLGVLTVLYALVFTGGAHAETIHVPGSYKTIQEAVDIARPNDTVVVDEGVYTENIVITRPLSLTSAKGPKLTIVLAASPDTPVITIADTSEVKLNGFTANGSKAAGILLSNAGNSVVINNHASENLYGIRIFKSQGNTVSDNITNSNVNYGIYLDKAVNNTVERNTANSNQDKGFFISYSDGNRIVDNNANLNAWDGMTIWASNHNVIRDNMTLRNTFGLVVNDSSDNELADNTTVPNILLILPIFLIYLGILTYMAQKNILRLIYRS